MTTENDIIAQDICLHVRYKPLNAYSVSFYLIQNDYQCLLFATSDIKTVPKLTNSMHVKTVYQCFQKTRPIPAPRSAAV